MTESQTPSVGALVRNYLHSPKHDEELHGNWVMALLHRWPGFLLSALFLRAGISANAVTLTGATFALILPLMAWLLPVPLAAWTVLVLGSLVITLDCCDGDIARWTGSASRHGAQLDFVVDMALWGLLYGSLGLLADRAGVGDGGAVVTGGWTALALGSAWLRLLARVINDAAGGGQTVGQGPWTVTTALTAFVAGLSGALPFLAPLVIWHPALIWLLALYAIADVVNALWRMMVRAG
ncbi:CDP-alcohol phosphatidyltransferase family protein [Pseudooceanicola sp.]|uniref:CDP-alcohol phosphatidyltransferase family protein n=1 Tax=Pseudooceanicola sp. TaxID=1914328 RepID=UPI00261446AE|nr:CDP-alcohol phosphatidyltransferase family protein [Pseudooceanicola sp.]MDF1856029.1 CDP-alcohol phosphatidyltransferase family protein [Pseudooceanicola sp.]